MKLNACLPEGSICPKMTAVVTTGVEEATVGSTTGAVTGGVAVLFTIGCMSMCMSSCVLLLETMLSGLIDRIFWLIVSEPGMAGSGRASWTRPMDKLAKWSWMTSDSLVTGVIDDTMCWLPVGVKDVKLCDLLGLSLDQAGKCFSCRKADMKF